MGGIPGTPPVWSSPPGDCSAPSPATCGAGASACPPSASGAVVEKCSLPLLDYAVPAYYILACAEASSNLARFDGVKYGWRAEGCGSLEELAARTVQVTDTAFPDAEIVRRYEERYPVFRALYPALRTLT